MASYTGSTSAKKSKSGIEKLAVGPMEDSVTGLVVDKGNIREFPKDGVSSQVFSFDLLDDTGAIRVSVFGRSLNALWESLRTDSVVRVSGGTVKAGNPRFNKTSKLEISVPFDGRGSVLLSTETVVPKPPSCNFVRIGDIATNEVNKDYDVIGVILSIEAPQGRQTRFGNRMLAKVRLGDQSERSVSCSFWGPAASQVEPWAPGDILAIQRATSQAYASSLCLECSRAKVRLDPDIPERAALRQWYQAVGGDNNQFLNMTSDVQPSSAGNERADEITLELPAQMQSSLETVRRVRIRCGTKQFVGILRVEDARATQVSMSTEASFDEASFVVPMTPPSRLRRDSSTSRMSEDH